MKGATSIQERLWELRKDKGLNLEELSEAKSMRISINGKLSKGVTAKDVALYLMSQLTTL